MRYAAHFPPLRFLKKVLFLLALFLLLATIAGAQTKGTAKTCQLHITCQSPDKTISITFTAAEEIDNVLIRIADEKGNTIFLDNRYHFKGDYKKAFKLDEFGGGAYSVYIVNDNEKFNQTILYEPGSK